MLATLKNFDPVARDGILASYVHALLPNPALEASPKSEFPDDLYKKLREEIGRELRIGPGDSPEIRQKILRFLSDQIRQNIIASKKIGEIRDRVAHKGDLPIGLYQIKYSDNFIKLSESMGVKRTDINAAIKNPDHVEHLNFIDGINDFGTVVTLISKTFRGSDPYVLLLMALREKTSLKIDGAWLIFHSDVDLSGAQTASEVLERFLNTFGTDVKVMNANEQLSAEGGEGKLILNKTFPMRPGAPAGIQTTNPEKTESDIKFCWKQSISTLSIVCAFSVDITKYSATLRKHGINITRTNAVHGRVHSERYVINPANL
ncbi:hypothetical protein ACIPF8_10630 [Collimonas sp. NPDC087041]|uniref:hypothetical protein n=1 Tax=Collimonas sp. NPDC087041 TaxID=3363960 RepID=UPI00381B4002